MWAEKSKKKKERKLEIKIELRFFFIETTFDFRFPSKLDLDFCSLANERKNERENIILKQASK